MFIDVATVSVRAGDGGSGIVSFHRTRGNSKGGPDGGDGGDGGDVVFVASTNENTLANFRYQKELKAEDGQGGSKGKKHGRNGVDLRVNVPVGTQVFSDDLLVADLTLPSQEAVIAKGGKGGFGNAHFTSSTRQTPRIAEIGEKGSELTCELELKMIADIGIVGLPNAGKSTLLSRVSNARPEIANYAFTTLRPNLGVATVSEGKELLCADIPGLIEGASEGKGLGDEFLRHIERTFVLIHVVDAYTPQGVVEAYKTIRAELKAYKIDLSTKPEIIALNKVDGLDDEIIEDLTRQLQESSESKSRIYAISAQSGRGLKELFYDVYDVVQKTKKAVEDDLAKNHGKDIPVITIERKKVPWTVEIQDEKIVIRGEKIERFAAKTDFESDDAKARLHDIMRKMGLFKYLSQHQATPGLPIFFGDSQKSYLEY